MPGNWWIAVGSSCPLILFVRIRISDNTVNQKGEKIRWISIHAILSYLKEKKKKRRDDSPLLFQLFFIGVAFHLSQVPS